MYYAAFVSSPDGGRARFGETTTGIMAQTPQQIATAHTPVGFIPLTLLRISEEVCARNVRVDADFSAA
jgi:hypothetical protein